ncbi:MAG: Flp pilus assembly complex ATPase component TadA [Candidatus Omnitrophica bacterium]|nr:Flp pilus assembly complex ATPase component TadA [Candidatus Omnitrophota bacterium]MBU1926063.1 Flp pilus assembly complex ATPase component TadA [Candidatus Omnitrophota bacterium]
MQSSLRFKSIGRILRERRLITEDALKEALDKQKESGLHLGQILIDLGYISEEQLLKALGIQSRMDVVDLEKLSIPRQVIEKIPAAIARLYNIAPISFKENILTVAISDPLNFSILDDLRFMFNCSIDSKLATQTAISDTIKKYYGRELDSVDDIFTEISEKIPDLFEDSDKIKNIDELASQLPIVQLLNLILIQAIKKKASDIHFEPFADEFKIRYRLDGVLYDIINPPKELHLPIASRIKVMANLNIAETRLPQDGRAFVKITGRMVDLRVSTLPTIFGESLVIRILDKATVQLSLDDLGLEDDIKMLFRRLIKKPYGIVLSTGPTGCGKTTTQYSCLAEINKIEYKIITVEDPVEFDLPGLIQVSVRPKINLTFPIVLRHMLRQDPDIIMVGEIRDTETVQMAIHAALTGHLVFSTLHTNDAPSAITRLIDMGVEPFLIASSIEGILAQRLVRRICDNCRQEYTPAQKKLDELGISPDAARSKKFYRGRGCDNCNNSGYKGRAGIFELLVLNEDLRDMILDRAPAIELRVQAIKSGMRTLREDGLLKVSRGVTTLDELIVITSSYI